MFRILALICCLLPTLVSAQAPCDQARLLYNQARAPDVALEERARLLHVSLQHCPSVAAALDLGQVHAQRQDWAQSRTVLH